MNGNERKPISHPIAEGFQLIGVKTSKGFELIKTGQLQTFTVGRFRYVTDEELRRFVQRRIEESAKETPADRAKKAEGTVASRAKRRQELAAA